MMLASLLIVNSCGAADSEEIQWRQLDPQNTILMTLPQGKVVVELAPQFSPNHVARFKTLAQENFYQNTSFYRVIEGFVAQAGPKDGSVKDKSIAKLAIEDQWATNKSFSFTPVQQQDLFAEQTGFKDGFAVGYSPKEQKAWLTHCPGSLAMARETGKNTATSHFYFSIGQAPRYLDRNMTIFGRVVYGMAHIQSINRTSTIEGEYAVDSRNHTKIVNMQLMSDVPEAEQIIIEVEDTSSEHFTQRLVKTRNRSHDFFYHKPPPVLDVCQVAVRSRLIKDK